MTEQIAATPGWVESRLDEVLASIPRSDALTAARNTYLDCLAGSKQPGAPSDLLGAEFNRCRRGFITGLEEAGIDPAPLAQALEALEAELDSGS